MCVRRVHTVHRFVGKSKRATYEFCSRREATVYCSKCEYVLCSLIANGGKQICAALHLQGVRGNK